jgi:hypothetical protein
MRYRCICLIQIDIFDHAETAAKPLAQAEDALSRLDERVRACSFRTGWLARLDFSEAIAWGWNSGQVLAAEDLLLHDESMDVRLPDEALRAGHLVVRARRKAMQLGGEVLSAEGAAWLAARRARPPSPALARPPKGAALDPERPLWPQLVSVLRVLEQGTTESAGQAVADWLGVLGLRHPNLPLSLHAAVALEAWRIVEPYSRETFLGPLLVAQWLRLNGRVGSHLLGIEAGVREVRRRDGHAAPGGPEARILRWVEALAAAGAAGIETLNRLELARQVALHRAGPRRAHARHQALIDLLLERPLITAPMAAQRLGIAPQTARRLIVELGGAVTEITGHARYRAWRL